MDRDEIRRRISGNYSSDFAGILDLTAGFGGEPLLPAVAPYEVQRANDLQRLEEEAQDHAARGDRYVPLFGWFTPGGTSFRDRLIGAAEAAFPLGDPIARVARFGEEQGVLPSGLTNWLPTAATNQSIVEPAGSRLMGGLASAAGFIPGFEDFGAQTQAATRALEAERSRQTVENYGESAGYLLNQGRAAGQSLAQSSVALVPGGQGLLIASQAGQTMGEAVNEAKRAGFSDSDAYAYGATQGAIEAGYTYAFQNLHKIPGLRNLASMLGPGLEGGLNPVAKELGKQAASQTMRGLAKEVGRNVLGEQLEEQLITATSSTLRALHGLDVNVPQGLRNLDDVATWVSRSLVPEMRDTFLQTLMASGAHAPLQAVAQRDADASLIRVTAANNELIEAQRAAKVRAAEMKEFDAQAQLVAELDAEALSEIRADKARAIIETLDESSVIQLANLKEPSRSAIRRVMGRQFSGEPELRLELVQQAKRLVAQDDLGAWTLTEDESTRRDIESARVERWADQPRFAADQGNNPAQFDAKPSLETYVNAAQALLKGGERMVNQVRRQDPGGDFEQQAMSEIASQPNWRAAARAIITRFTAESESRRKGEAIDRLFADESQGAVTPAPEQGALSRMGSTGLRAELQQHAASAAHAEQLAVERQRDAFFGDTRSVAEAVAEANPSEAEVAAIYSGLSRNVRPSAEGAATTAAPAESRNPKEPPPGWHLAANGQFMPDLPPAEDMGEGPLEISAKDVSAVGKRGRKSSPEEMDELYRMSGIFGVMAEEIYSNSHAIKGFSQVRGAWSRLRQALNETADPSSASIFEKSLPAGYSRDELFADMRTVRDAYASLDDAGLVRPLEALLQSRPAGLGARSNEARTPHLSTENIRTGIAGPESAAPAASDSTTQDPGDGFSLTTDKAGQTLRKVIPNGPSIAVRIREVKGEWRVSDSNGRALNAGKKSAQSEAKAVAFAKKWLEREAEDIYTPAVGHRIVYTAGGELRTSPVVSVDQKARTATTEAGDVVPWKEAARSGADRATDGGSGTPRESADESRIDADRRAISPARFLEDDTPAALKVEQLGQVLRQIQTADEDPTTRRYAVGARTQSSTNAINQHADRFRKEHGDQAEAAVANEISAAVRTLPPSDQATFWAGVRGALANPSEADTTAQAVANAMRAELGPQAESAARQQWAAVIKAQVKGAQNATHTYGRPLLPPREGKPGLSTKSVVRQPSTYDRLGPMSGPLSRAPQGLIDKLAKFAGEFVGGKPTVLSTNYVAPDAAGQFDPYSQTARTNPNDFDTAAHEVGHDLIARSNVMSSLAQSPNFNAVDRELTGLGLTLYGATVPSAGYQAEGFSEFLRYAIGDPAQAKQLAPQTFLWFGTELASRPRAAKAFDEIQQQATKWVGTSAADRYATLMQSSTAVKRGVWTIEKAKRYLWDGLAALRQFTTSVDKNRLEQGLAELPVHLRPDERARRVVGTAPGVTAQFIGDVREWISQGSVEWGTHKRNGESLMQILKPITGKGDKPLKDFGVYLWGRRTLAFERADAQATATGQAPREIETGMMRNEAAQVVADLEQRYPEFRRMAQGVYDLMGRVNQFMKDASPTLESVATQVEASDPGDYVPLHRLFEDYDDAFASFAARHGGTSGTRHAKFTEEIRGSTRPPADVLEQLQLEIERRVQLAMERHVLESVVNVAEPGNASSTFGMGEFITRIEPSPEAVARAMKDPRVVAVVKDGETRFYEVNEPMADTLKGVSATEAQLLANQPVAKVVDKILSPFTRVTKLGAVGLNPSFVLAKGAWQDVVGMLTKSSIQGKPAQKLAALLSGYRATLQWALTGKTTPEVEALLASGVLSTSPWTNERTANSVLKRAAIEGSELSARQGWAVVTNIAEAAERLGAAMQMGPQLAEMKLVAKNLGTTVEGATPEQQVQILNAGKALMSFAEKGAAFKLLDRWLPFASIPFTAARSLVEFAQKNPKAAAVRLGAAWGLMVLYYLTRRDDEWWKDLDERQKFGGFAINRGQGQPPMFIPFNSTEMQIGFGLPLALMSSFEKSDPEEAKNVLGAMSRQFVPSLNPLMEQAIKQATNTRDLRYGGELVTRPAAEDNWNADTTLLARWFGENLGIAPTRIDSALDDFTGGLAPNSLRTLEGMRGQRLYEAADRPVIGGLYSRGTDTTATARGWRERFYRVRNRLEGMSDAERAQESPFDKKIRTTVNNAAEALSHLQELAKSARTLEERDRWDQEAVDIARDAINAVEDGRTLPWIGRRASRLQREREALRAR